MFDAVTKFSDAQALSGLTGNQPATYELDFEETVLPDGVTTQDYPDKGAGSPLVVRFLISVAATTGTSVAFALCFDTATCHGGNAPTVLIQTRAFLEAELTVGAYIPELKVPDMHARFCNVVYIITGDPGALVVSTFLDIATGMRHR
jgi:hypothetical protein